jgi:hypothetical protein
MGSLQRNRSSIIPPNLLTAGTLASAGSHRIVLGRRAIRSLFVVRRINTDKRASLQCLIS